MKIAFSLALTLFLAMGALAQDHRTLSVKEAKKLALEFAQKDEAHMYGGEVELEEATHVLNTAWEKRLFQVLLASVSEHYENDGGNVLDVSGLTAYLKKHQIEVSDLYNHLWGMNAEGDYYVVAIDYLDCDSWVNFLSVSKKTREVEYLFSAKDYNY